MIARSRQSLLALALVSLLWLVPGLSPAAERLPVFLFAGQSNMAGYGTRDFAPPQKAAQWPVLYSWRDAHPGRAWTFQEKRPLQRDPLGFWGPEMGFAQAWVENHATPRPVAIIKVSNGGTSLWQDWNPHYAEEKTRLDPKFLPSHGRDDYVPMWDALIRHTRDSLQSLRAQGFEPQLQALFWCQGESDGKSRQEYEPLFRRFMEDLRSALDEPALPVILVETGPPEVIAAQRKVAAEMGGTSLRTDNQGYRKPDGVHWDGPALLDIGRRLAQAWKQRDG
jgi:hypothetical protein